ncbi:AAA family ATPase [Stenotrophomonas maltophilia]|uniref:AAA family ATPase n=1 Tax=Stenotrophomonas maltophilia TaxID=40324 RepID=UPI0021C6FB24|nr:AAA family ATPase [Stenotrophomonas maltophilia]MCU1156860.1 AAA family ATPase [Stenotrophomonas maltophilia]
MTADPTSFERDLDRIKPRLFGVVRHRNFIATELFLRTFCENIGGGNIIAIIGPSNCGKSLLLLRLAKYLREVVFREARPESTPIIGAFVLPSNDSRVTPKYVIQMLLGDAGHPLYDPVKLEQSRYRGTAGSKTEAHYLKLLRNLFSVSRIEFVLLDDAQSIARTKSEEFGATLLEALKVLSGPGQNLILTGGYELLGPLLAHRAHLAARVTIVHLSPYEGEADYGAWQSIIKAIEKANPHGIGETGALRACSRELYIQCHGCIGILEKRLQQVTAYAAACNQSITAEMIRAVKPAQAEWSTVAKDIELGKAALAQVPDAITPRAPCFDAEHEDARSAKRTERTTASSSSPHKKQPAKSRPFQRKPARVPGS